MARGAILITVLRLHGRRRRTHSEFFGGLSYDFRMLDPTLLSSFAENFFGYGNPHAPLWFIGLEEGSGGEEDEIQRRLAAWNASGRPRWLDAAEFHNQAGMGSLFSLNCSVQPTWRALMRICMKVADPGDHVIRRAAFQQFQSQRWGRRAASHCLAELRPLPCPSTLPKDYRYHTWTDPQELPWLHAPIGHADPAAARAEARARYETAITPLRIARLQEHIDEYAPRVIVFYGMTALPLWNEVAIGADLQGATLEVLHVGNKGKRRYSIRQATTPDGRLYLAMCHPSWGNALAYLHAIAARVRAGLV